MRRIVLCATVALLAVQSAFAGEPGGFYSGDPVKGYRKAEFVVLKSNDVNIRTAPETGNIIKTMNKHSLFRVLKHEGKWLRVNADGMTGSVYEDFTGSGSSAELTEEDFFLDEEILGKKFSEKDIGGLGKLLHKGKAGKQTLYEYEARTVAVNNKNAFVEAVEIRDPGVITMRGISVGDASWRLVGQYGVPDAVSYRDDKVVYEYCRKNERKDVSELLFFVDMLGNITKFMLQKGR